MPSQPNKPRYRWTVTWGNPYREPPDGGPRDRFSLVSTARRCPPEVDRALDILGGPGCGFSVHFRPQTETSRRTWSLPAKQRRRRANLRKRLRRHAPLFATKLYPDELAKRPDYFGTPDPEEETP